MSSIFKMACRANDKEKEGKGLPSDLRRRNLGEGSKEERNFWCDPSHSLPNQVMIYLFIDCLVCIGNCASVLHTLYLIHELLLTDPYIPSHLASEWQKEVSIPFLLLVIAMANVVLFFRL